MEQGGKDAEVFYFGGGVIVINCALDRFLKDERTILRDWLYSVRSLDRDYRCGMARSAVSLRPILTREECVPLSILAADRVFGLPGRLDAVVFKFIVRWNTAAAIPRLFYSEEI